MTTVESIGGPVQFIDPGANPEDTLESPWRLERPARTVLVVDDEVHILKAVRRLFLDSEHEVLTATSGKEALALMEQEPIAVLISDQRMPEMTGSELLRQTRQLYPNTVRIMLTGNNDVSTATSAINEGEVFRFVTKPWEHDDFLALIKLAMEHHELLTARERYERHIKAQNEKLRQLNDELEARVEERTAEVVARQKEVSGLYKELQTSFDATIKALLSIMELGDTQAVEHCHRTARRLRYFCESEGYNPDLVRDLERAALLHWMGLTNAPASLFQKRIEDFNAEEQATWEFHPLLGQQAISDVPALRQAARFILFYLRRYDDAGFQPGELADDGEPFTEGFLQGCYVLSICSAFEREQTRLKKTGRNDPRLALKQGLNVLREGSGTHFHPHLVSRFCELVGRELEATQQRELVVSFEQLEPGMVLARPLETAQGIPVAPRDMIVTVELIDRLARFRSSNGLNVIYVWS